ncbi:hypothetical protein A0J61_01819 [Choanephora cucurbitarum]|uniref:Uncharacterized protein n=1 Tax=Choanephora cucurbitarum TaxID=101091 RepID=A0A1C7NLV6_9FUNG|nr:hypothetical protein A0J61_01819 [Choanephora cucurbitarum]
MSEAKVYTSLQNVRTAAANQEKKTVFKHVLASPFILKWPTIHTDLGQTILDQLLKTVEPLGKYKSQCRAEKKKRKKNEPVELIEPELRQRTFIGINQVTRYLEAYIENERANPKSKTDRTPVMYICKREIKPLQLCQHLLYMSALAKIKVAPMPANAENRIGKALGIQRASVVLLEIMENKEESLRLSARDLPLVEAPWLENALTRNINYIGDTTKTLMTTVPIVKKNQQQSQKNDLKRKSEVDDSANENAKKLKQSN